MIKSIHGLVRPSFIGGTSLITHWDIQNTSSYSGTGTTISDLDSTNPGLIVGSVPYTNGVTRYLSLDSGTSNYVRTTVSLNASLSPVNTGTSISIFVWVYPTSNGVILSEQGTTTPDTNWYDSQIEWVSGTPRFGVWAGSLVNVASLVAAGLNEWHYVGFSYDGTTLRAYVNGQFAGSVNVSRQTPYNNNSGGILYYALGYPTGTNMGGGGGSNYRLGALHVWNTGIPASTVLNNYKSTKSSYGR